METVNETQEVISNRRRLHNTNIWYHNCPLVRKHQFFGENVGDPAQLYVANGEIKKGFEWIMDDDVICTDAIDGLKVSAEFGAGCDLITVSTRHQRDVNLFQHMPILEAVGCYAKNNIKANSVMHETWGVIPGNPAKIIQGGFIDWTYIPYESLRKHFRRDQWHTGPKTVKSMSSWLYEDLERQYGMIESVQSVYSSKNKAGNYRSDGIMFWQDTGFGTIEHPLYRVAKVHNRCFPWWWVDNNRINIQDSHVLNMVRKDIFNQMSNG
jgi:hypothetical protein